MVNILLQTVKKIYKTFETKTHKNFSSVINILKICNQIITVHFIENEVINTLKITYLRERSTFETISSILNYIITCGIAHYLILILKIQ